MDFVTPGVSKHLQRIIKHNIVQLEARNRFKRRYRPDSKEELQKDCEESADAAPCATCRYVRSQHCGSDDPKLRCRKQPAAVVPSYESLTNSATGSCRYCCCTLGVFFQEIHAALQGNPNSRVCDSLSEIGDIFLALLTDFVLFLRRLGCDAAAAAIAKSREYAAGAAGRIKLKTINLIKQKLHYDITDKQSDTSLKSKTN